ncbi:hypothetical protein N1851_012565 [Merluccius polli]|uniref:Uncharacterized protein n=1 Tax=Merluccius polli TaxID=89951 RepID=A0AA47MX15_MERPO|nr:hypothetical protein N1851_012565 [Merluccius polli]
MRRDIRSLPDVTMTGNCTPECSELGHSDACWMPGHPSPLRKAPRTLPKLSTFVPYQERGSLGRLANGSARPAGEEPPRPRLPPSRSAYGPGGGHAPSVGHAPSGGSQDCPLEEIPLNVSATEFQAASPPSANTPKREIYLYIFVWQKLKWPQSFSIFELFFAAAAADVLHLIESVKVELDVVEVDSTGGRTRELGPYRTAAAAAASSTEIAAVSKRGAGGNGHFLIRYLAHRIASERIIF